MYTIYQINDYEDNSEFIFPETETKFKGERDGNNCCEERQYKNSF